MLKLLRGLVERIKLIKITICLIGNKMFFKIFYNYYIFFNFL